MEAHLNVDGRSPQSQDVLEETSPTLPDAQAALRRLTVALGTQIRERGGTVLTVETGDDGE